MRYFLYSVIFLFVLVHGSLRLVSSDEAFCEPTSPRYLSKQKHNLAIYSDFTDFGQLNLDCDAQRLELNLSMSARFSVNFVPSKSFYLDKPIPLDAFSRSQYNLEIFIFYMKAIDAAMINSIFELGPIETIFHIYFERSNLRFYMNDPLNQIDANMCNSEYFASLNIQLFSNMSNAFIYFSQTTRHEYSICPFVFKNALIFKLSFFNMRYDRIIKNRLRFYSLPLSDPDMTDTLNSSITAFELADIYRVEIDESLLHPWVFGKTNSFTIIGTLSKVHPDLFKSLMSVNLLYFYFYNTREFFHMSDNKWLASIFPQGVEYESIEEMANASVSIDDTIELLFKDYLGLYDYPN